MKHINEEFIYSFIKQHRSAVLSTISPDSKPEAALVGIAVTPDLKIIFDTLSDSRKYTNLLLNPYIAFVIGWDNDVSVQYEGKLCFATGEELESIKNTYFEFFPDGPERLNWPNISYLCVEPLWISYTDFNYDTMRIEELDLSHKISIPAI